jgi:hypothetical protein
MAKEHFSKKQWSASPVGHRQNKNTTGGDASRKERLKRESAKQTKRSHGTERRQGGPRTR